MKTSESINELAAALAKAQGEMGPARKGAANPFFKSHYADLAAVVSAMRQPFSENGLAYAQATDFDETDCIIVVTRLMHASGQWIEGMLRMKPTKNDPQSIGSTITYARRYALQSMAGVPAEDDDGNAGTGNGTEPRRAAAAKAAATDGKEPPSSEERTQAFEALNGAFAHLYRESPDTMPFGPSDRSEKAQKARLDLVSQIMGTEIKDIRGLTTDALKRCAAELPKAFANGGK